MKRRTFIVTGASSIVGATSGAAWPQKLSSDARERDQKPYETLDKAIANDRKKVIEFIAYTCVSCQRYHSAIQSWATSLPRSISFESIAIPLNSSEDELKLLLFRAEIERLAPMKMKLFDSQVLDALRINGNKINPHVIADAIKYAGIDGGITGQMSFVRAQKRISEWMDRAAQYQITRTPTIAIDGKYTTSPDAIPGRDDLFPTLLNGLVSKAIES